MYTEHEAAGRWCPYRGEVTVSADGTAKLVYCIGSNCMMWRWEKRYDISIAGKVEEGEVTEGYCGLGGKP